MGNAPYTVLDTPDYPSIRFPEALASHVKTSRIVLKPNISMRAPGSYTHPLLIRKLADYFSSRGADVVIAEGMHLKHFKQVVLQSTGYADLFKDYPFVDLETEKCRLVRVESDALKSVAVPELLLDAGVSLVNVPKLKTHLMTLFTGPVKNIAMGIVNQHSKAEIHRIAGGDFQVLAGLLVDTYLALEPRVAVTVVDAVDIMTGNGPSRGRVERRGKVLFGNTCDLEWACLQLLGLDSSPITARLELKHRPPPAGTPLRGPRTRLPDTYAVRPGPRVRRLFNHEYWSSVVCGPATVRSDWYRVRIDKRACIRCGECRAHCPTGAISPHYTIDPALCSRCLCCVENCPRNASSVVLRRRFAWADRWVRLFY